MPSIQVAVYVGNHILLYLVLIALVVSGVSMLVLSGLAPVPLGLVPGQIKDVPPRSAHHLFALVLIALLVIHLAGVLHYQLLKGDTLARMGVLWFSRWSKSADASGD